jgi:NAD(P)-dependent dehydrogenase (short-subunit alcohol dehydrogenase family)
MGNFTGKVVLITGAGRGTGRALALAFASQGAIVAANDITPVNLDETIDLINQAGGRTKDYITDISKKMPVQAMLNEILDDWGRLDILINNAHVDPNKSLLDIDEWDWRRTVDVNITGPLLVSQSAGRIMKEAGGGIIINVLSGGEGFAALRSNRFGLIGLTQELAAEFSAYNIRVNAVSLSTMGLPSVIGHPGDQTTTDIIQATLYLCGPEASEISGKVVALDV